MTTIDVIRINSAFFHKCEDIIGIEEEDIIGIDCTCLILAFLAFVLH